MNDYLKPQTPIKNGDDYIYPLTTVDQVIDFDTGERLNQRLTPEGVGAVPSNRKVNGKSLSEDIALTTQDVGVPKDNLLDNWYFVRPVNQRNVSGKISTLGYFIDRWKLMSGTVELTSNGLVLNGTIVQILEFAPTGEVTASALTNDGDILQAAYSAEDKTFTLTGNGQTIVAAKLEEGSQQTLAHREADKFVLNKKADYQTELSNCRRYLYYAPSNNDRLFAPHLIQYNNSGGQAFMPVPVKMRIAPTIIGESKIKIISRDSNIDQTEATIIGCATAENGVMIQVSNLKNGPFCIYFMGGSGLDANL